MAPRRGLFHVKPWHLKPWHLKLFHVKQRSVPFLFRSAPKPEMFHVKQLYVKQLYVKHAEFRSGSWGEVTGESAPA